MLNAMTFLQIVFVTVVVLYCLGQTKYAKEYIRKRFGRDGRHDEK